MQPKSSGYSSTTQIQDPSSPGNNLILLGGSLAAEEETQWEEIQSKSTVISNSISMWISWRAAVPCSTREHWFGASTEIWFLVVSPACSLLMQPGIHSGDPCVCQSSFLHLCSSLTGDPVCAHQRHYLASLLGLGQLLNFGDTQFGWALPGNKNILFLWCHLPGSAAQQQLLLGAPCRVVPATCPLLPAWGRAVLPAGRHQQGRCSPCSLQAVTAPVAQGGAHTCPVCASRARDIATLPLRRMGQESWTLFSPSPTHCHAGERGVICAGHGANMDCDNLHFCYFLFPGKREKVKPVLAIVGCILPYSKAMV